MCKRSDVNANRFPESQPNCVAVIHRMGVCVNENEFPQRRNVSMCVRAPVTDIYIFAIVELHLLQLNGSFLSMNARYERKCHAAQRLSFEDYY